MRDDLSSCSSNCFKSFPRRPCCSTAVGFLVAEKDLKSCNSRRRRRSRRNTTTTTTLLLAPRSSSVLQRASEAVIKAIKSLPHKSSGRSKKDVMLLEEAAEQKLLEDSGSEGRGRRRKYAEMDKDFIPRVAYAG
ncbi:hypothetical protein PIB30_023923 [Stylosanthes scabra]|uniref:Uncharacterized protein n=1 Tax=Stylosanthes scabra TaxID=79078 RepID=A0ABU6V8K5_9FABA|nr:hypothetical protein [Stylosanthes scabra]